MAPRLITVVMTPAWAAELLTLNTGNRPLRPGVVQTYARDMEAGRWRFTGAPIVINGRRLLDGQHRLAACVETGVSFQTAALLDADEEIHFAIDKGRKRTVSDELTWRGEANTGDLGSVLNLLWAYEKQAFASPSVASTAELLAFLDANPAVRESIPPARAVSRDTGIARAPYAAADYLMRREHGDEAADRFGSQVRSGAGLEAGDPVLALRAYGLRVAGNRTLRPRREDWLAIVLKAANAWLMGREVRTLRWRRYGYNAEPFPMMLGRGDVS